MTSAEAINPRAGAAMAVVPAIAHPSPPEEKDQIYIPKSFGAGKQEEVQHPELFYRALGIPPSGPADSCGVKRVGIVGASNTLGKSYVQYLQRLCPRTKFIVRAHGGYSPREQLHHLLPSLLKEKIEQVIISPSGNALDENDHVAAITEMVEKIKQKGISTTVLSVSPRPESYRTWSYFNDYLLQEKLGIPQLVDTTVDITTPLLKTDSSDICGYCQRDGVHWNDLGDQRVAVQIYNTLWAKEKLPLPE